MHIYSIILIGLFIYNLGRTATYKSKLVFQTTVTAWVYLFTNRGYFFESSFLNVEYWQAAIIFELLLLIAGRKITTVSKRMAAFFASLAISAISLMVLPAEQARVVGNAGAYELFMAGVQQYIHPEFTKLTVFFFALAVIQALVFDSIYREFNKEDMVKLVLNLAKLSKILLVIGVTEFLLKNLLQSNIYNDVMVMIFGKGSSSYTVLIQRGSLYMLTGLSREGSHYAYALSIVVVLLFAAAKQTKQSRYYWWIIIAVMQMVLSGAFTLVVSVLMLVAFYCVFYVGCAEGNRRKFAKVFGLGAAAVAIGFLGEILYNTILPTDGYITKRLTSAFSTLEQIFTQDAGYYTNLATIDSTTTRLYSIVDTLRNWFYRPLFGLGEGTTHCHGSAALAIAEIGLVGMVTYFCFYFGKFVNDRSLGKVAWQLLTVWLLANLVSGGASRMYLSIDGVIIMMAAHVIFCTGENEHEMG